MIAIPRIAHCEYKKVCVFFSNTLKEISDHFIYRFNLIVVFNIYFQKKHIVVQQNIVWKEISSPNLLVVGCSFESWQAGQQYQGNLVGKPVPFFGPIAVIWLALTRRPASR